MWMSVGERRFAITLSDTAAARAFAAQLPLTLEMAELNGNEKHAELAKALPTNASRPGTIRAGDLMLYGCDVAKGSEGEAFIADLAKATGADVAASSASGSGRRWKRRRRGAAHPWRVPPCR